MADFDEDFDGNHDATAKCRLDLTVPRQISNRNLQIGLGLGTLRGEYRLVTSIHDLQPQVSIKSA